MKKIIAFVLVFAMLQTAGFCFWGGDNGNGRGRASGYSEQYRPFNHLSRELNLTKDQLRDLDRISLDFQRDILPLETKMREQRLKLQELYQNSNVTQDQVKDVVREIGRIRITIEEKRVDNLFLILKVLTPEQRDKLRDLKLFSNFMGRNMYDKPCRPGAFGGRK